MSAFYSLQCCLLYCLIIRSRKHLQRVSLLPLIFPAISAAVYQFVWCVQTDKHHPRSEDRSRDYFWISLYPLFFPKLVLMSCTSKLFLVVRTRMRTLAFIILVIHGILKTLHPTAVQPLSALRDASAYSTMSENMVCIIASMLPIQVLAQQWKCPIDLRKEERRASIGRWQDQCGPSTKTRCTHRLMPQVGVWLNRPYSEVSKYLALTQSGHWCFAKYLHTV